MRLGYVALGLIAVFALILIGVYFAPMTGVMVPTRLGEILVAASLVGECLSAILFIWALVIRSF